MEIHFRSIPRAYQSQKCDLFLFRVSHNTLYSRKPKIASNILLKIDYFIKNRLFCHQYFLAEIHFRPIPRSYLKSQSLHLPLVIVVLYKFNLKMQTYIKYRMYILGSQTFEKIDLHSEGFFRGLGRSKMEPRITFLTSKTGSSAKNGR